jgi:ceramide glucosyltransferase
MNFPDFLGYLATFFSGLGLLTTLFGTFYALSQFRRRAGVSSDARPPVSVLKPVKGADSGLEANLESFFLLEYPEYELLFCAMTADDPAVSVVEKLRVKYPKVKSRMILGGMSVGPNPKVNNLLPAYFAADYDHVVISDSNVRVQPDYLSVLAKQLTPGIGVVTSVVAGDFARGMGGHIESAYLNTFYARWMHLSALMGVPCVVGKSMFFRRSDANRFGGISILGRYINEDYMVGKAMQQLGLRVLLARDPIRQYIGDYSLREFWSRHIRWGRIRKSQAPFAFSLEPMMTLVGSAALGVWGLAILRPDIPPLAFLLVHLSVWATGEWLLLKELTTVQRSKVFVGWFLRELLALPLWLKVASGNKVTWRGSELKLRSGGLLRLGK